MNGINNAGPDTRKSHQGTRLALGRFNANCFSRTAWIIEIGYRGHYDEHPTRHVPTPYLKWGKIDLWTDALRANSGADAEHHTATKPSGGPIPGKCNNPLFSP